MEEKSCWICRRSKGELEDLGIELVQIEGVSYPHTVCEACEDIIFGVRFENEIREKIKYLLQDIIDSDIFSNI